MKKTPRSENGHSASHELAPTSGHIFKQGRKFCYKNRIWGVLRWFQTFKKVKNKKVLLVNF